MTAIKGISTADTAALRVETVNGTFVVEQRLRVQLQCLERPDPAARALQGGNCFARLDVVRAPKGKLDALVALIDGRNMIKEVANQQWMSAALARQQQQGQAAMDALRRQAAGASAMLRSSVSSSWPPCSATIRRLWHSRNRLFRA